MNNIRTTEMVVKGDVLGTGILSVAQLVRLAQALNGSAPLFGAYLLAGDLLFYSGHDGGGERAVW